MQCKSCGTELPKKAKICPKCGALNGKPAGNTRYTWRVLQLVSEV